MISPQQLVVGWIECAAAGTMLLTAQESLRTRSSRSFQPMSGLLLTAMLLVGSIRLSTAEAHPQENSNDSETVDNWQVQVHVVDVDGKPISNPKIGIQNGGNVDTTWQEGDALGKAVVDFETQTPSYVYIRARANGFAPMQAYWSNRDGRPADPLPREFTFTMLEATTVGGTVQDEEGKGIAGAIVRFSAEVQQDADASRATVGFWEEVYTTDEQGRWACDLAPRSMNQCSINVYHEEYVYVSDAVRISRDIASLLDRSHKWILKKGFAISGHVLDESGNAIEGAILGLGELNISSSEGPFRRTDKDGEYRFQAVSPRREESRDEPLSFTITILKQGFQPLLERVPGYGKRSMEGSTPDARVANFVLRKGVPFTLHIVDGGGQPIEGAEVWIWNWRGTQTLTYLQKSVLPTTTDEKGLWSWDDFPVDGSIRLNIIKSGFALVLNHEIESHGEAIETTIVLRHPQIVMGTVVDKVTMQPIPEFVVNRAFEGVTGHPGGLSWTDPLRGRDGNYRMTVSQPPRNGSYTYRAIADGYETSTSESTAYKEGETTVLNFELTPKPPSR